MRFAKLYVRTALLASLLLAVSACQTAQKRAPLLPPASAPSLKAAAPTPAAPQPKSPVPAQTNEAAAQVQPEKPTSAEEQPAPSQPDPVADLIARVEKDYQAGVANYQAGKP